LPRWHRPLAVVAHPDDESFGLGALLAAWAENGARPAVLCFTHGEASTLHGVEGELRELRAGELAEAARVLGVDDVHLLDLPDGGLAEADPAVLAAHVRARATDLGADGLLVFDPSGVTGHPDHIAATAAALRAASEADLPVLAWTLPQDVADRLRTETGAAFEGVARPELSVAVDRTRQLRAARAHASQALSTSVLWRRLELLGDCEHLRWLRRPPGPDRSRRDAPEHG